MTPGDILGHEPMGIVEAVGSSVTNIVVGDPVVVPFNISCGHCFMCTQGLQSQCETTQVRDMGCGAALFGYTKLYGQVPGGQAELLRVPHADYGPIKVPHGPADDRFLFLSDVLPTAWQAVQYAAAPKDGTVARTRPRPDRRHGMLGSPSTSESRMSSASIWFRSGSSARGSTPAWMSSIGPALTRPPSSSTR